uniref:Uncharacterized protein n=1 Tax=Leersia perrieri TaxID=77586 RepID=A0A0D9X9Y5_9ORYZ
MIIRFCFGHYPSRRPNCLCTKKLLDFVVLSESVRLPGDKEEVRWLPRRQRVHSPDAGLPFGHGLMDEIGAVSETMRAVVAEFELEEAN